MCIRDRNNSGDNLAISADGDFVFPTEIKNGEGYSVSVLTQPGSPTQQCTVSNGSGTVSDNNVSSVIVTCVIAYTVGGNVSGLSGSGLVLQNNSGDNLGISSNGAFTFNTALLNGDSYTVSVLSNPTTPSQTCAVSSGSGTVGTAAVANVDVSCVTETFSVGGTVSGLNGSGLVLSINGGETLAVASNGAFTFVTSLDDGSYYEVDVATVPSSPDQTCTITNSSGYLDGGNADNISVACANSYSLSGTLSGLEAGSTVTLQNNGGDDLVLAADGAFTFSSEASDASDYEVTVSDQPIADAQYCNVIDGKGTVESADVSGMTVKCVTGLYNIVDTNQTNCYSSSTGMKVACGAAGAGQDGAYSGAAPSYTAVDDGKVVLDNNTGLMWQASSDTDGVAGLDDDDKMTQPEAEIYCSNLTYGSYSDWRLPSIKELYSIYLMSGEDLSGKTGATSNGTSVDTTGIEPFIDTTYFDVGYGDPSAGERMIDGQYVTSTIYAGQTKSGFTGEYVDAVFGLNFVDGHLKGYEKDATVVSDARYYVRCVHGNTEYGKNDFSDNGDDTITDNATSMMWQKYDSAADDFDDAISICEAATTGGYTDWRLPNVKELHSVLDYTRAPTATSSPAIDTSYFSSTSFTNEAGDTDWAYYWSSTALLNYSGRGNKGAYIAFGRALGYFSGVADVHGAGAQRSDHKTVSGRDADNVTAFTVDEACTFGDTGYRKGPQGDILRVDHNYLRCVRDPN